MTCRATECPRHSRNRGHKGRACPYEQIAGRDGNVCKHPEYRELYEAAEAAAMARAEEKAAEDSQS